MDCLKDVRPDVVIKSWRPIPIRSLPKLSIFIISILFFYYIGSPPSPVLADVSGSREIFEFEPVFQGQVYLTEAGWENPVGAVLIHGVGDLGARAWESVIPELAKHYHVVAFDLPGFGRSSKNNMLYSPLSYAAFVKWVVDRYIRGPYVLIGHSLGGGIALRYAATYPRDLQRLVLIDVAGVLHPVALTEYLAHMKLDQSSSEWFSGSKNIIKNLASSLLERFHRLGPDADLALGSESFRRKMLSGDPAKIASLALVEENFSSLIERVLAPTLIYWGEHDQVTPVRIGKLLSSNLPTAQLEIIPNVGHSPMLEDPQRFTHLLLKGLSSKIQKKLLPPFSPESPVGRCLGKDGAVFKGPYQRIEIRKSRNVRLVDVITQMVEISESEVVIENTHIKGDETGLILSDSRLIATALRIEANIAIKTSKSRLDLAGVYLTGNPSVISTLDQSNLLFSVSRLRSHQKDYYMHGVTVVTPSSPL